jgi:hypothetical protein
MSQKTEKVFASGIYFKEPQATAPDWVIGGLSMNAENAIQFINEHKNADGWVKCNIKRSQGGKSYVELDTWKPTNQSPVNDAAASQEPPVNDEQTDDLPF